jgi:hypothetical protein
MSEAQNLNDFNPELPGNLGNAFDSFAPEMPEGSWERLSVLRNKRKRFFLWWTIPALLVSLALGTWFGYNVLHSKEEVLAVNGIQNEGNDIQNKVYSGSGKLENGRADQNLNSNQVKFTDKAQSSEVNPTKNRILNEIVQKQPNEPKQANALVIGDNQVEGKKSGILSRSNSETIIPLNIENKSIEQVEKDNLEKEKIENVFNSMDVKNENPLGKPLLSASISSRNESYSKEKHSIQKGREDQSPQKNEIRNSSQNAFSNYSTVKTTDSLIESSKSGQNLNGNKSAGTDFSSETPLHLGASNQSLINANDAKVLISQENPEANQTPYVTAKENLKTKNQLADSSDSDSEATETAFRKDTAKAQIMETQKPGLEIGIGALIVGQSLKISAIDLNTERSIEEPLQVKPMRGANISLKIRIPLSTHWNILPCVDFSMLSQSVQYKEVAGGLAPIKLTKTENGFVGAPRVEERNFWKNRWLPMPSAGLEISYRINSELDFRAGLSFAWIEQSKEKSPIVNAPTYSFALLYQIAKRWALRTEGRYFSMSQSIPGPNASSQNLMLGFGLVWR